MGARMRLATGALAVAVLPATGAAVMVHQPDAGPPGRIVVSRDDGTGGRTLAARGAIPVVSPDGTRVAALTLPGAYAGRVRLIDVTGGRARTTSRVCRGGLLAWSPDSTRVACITESAAADGTVTGNGLAVVEAATGRSRVLVRAPGREVGSVGWAPDGRRIAYSDSRFGAVTPDVFVIAADGGSRPRLLIRRADRPVWGPRIAVARYSPRPAGAPATRTQVWTVGPGGGGARQLTSFRTTSPLVTGPSPALWVPGGRFILGAIGGTDTSDLVRVDARSGALVRLGPTQATVDGVSPDGRTLLFTTGFTGPGLRTRTMTIAGREGPALLRGAAFVSVSRDWTPGRR
jgi:hypothetical protein